MRVVRPENFTDRELSWLSFDERVLELAEDPNVPLLERIRFLAIFSSNLDEFFMVRIAALKDKSDNQSHFRNSAGYLPGELMKEILKRIRKLMDRQSRLYRDVLLPELKENGVEIVSWDDLDLTEKKYIIGIFNERIF